MKHAMWLHIAQLLSVSVPIYIKQVLYCYLSTFLYVCV